MYVCFFYTKENSNSQCLEILKLFSFQRFYDAGMAWYPKCSRHGLFAYIDIRIAHLCWRLGDDCNLIVGGCLWLLVQKRSYKLGHVIHIAIKLMIQVPGWKQMQKLWMQMKRKKKSKIFKNFGEEEWSLLDSLPGHLTVHLCFWKYSSYQYRGSQTSACNKQSNFRKQATVVKFQTSHLQFYLWNCPILKTCHDFGSLRFLRRKLTKSPPINPQHFPWTSSARSTLRALRLTRRFWFFPPNKWLIHCLVHWRQFWRQVESKIKISEIW